MSQKFPLNGSKDWARYTPKRMRISYPHISEDRKLHIQRNAEAEQSWNPSVRVVFVHLFEDICGWRDPVQHPAGYLEPLPDVNTGKIDCVCYAYVVNSIVTERRRNICNLAF